MISFYPQLDGSEAAQLDGGNTQQNENHHKHDQNGANAFEGQEVIQPDETDSDEVSQQYEGITSIPSKTSREPTPVNVREYNSLSTSVNICTDRQLLPGEPIPQIGEGKEISD